MDIHLLPRVGNHVVSWLAQFRLGGDAPKIQCICRLPTGTSRFLDEPLVVHNLEFAGVYAAR